MKTLTILFLAALAFLCLFASDVFGGGYCVKQVVQPVVVPQQVYQFYRVGEGIYVDDLIVELRSLRAEIASLRSTPTPTPQPETAPAVTSMISQKCAKCHTGNQPKGGLFLDGQTPLECSSITQALRMISTDKMPPPDSGLTLSPQEKGQLMQELLDLERQDP